MKGDNKVIEQLNTLLAGELTAMDQYFIHSRMYQDWGLDKLYERINQEMQDETGHADVLIKRILFLEGVPDLSKRAPLAIGSHVPEMLKNDLELEPESVLKTQAQVFLYNCKILKRRAVLLRLNSAFRNTPTAAFSRS
jgi:bacterioferritin